MSAAVQEFLAILDQVKKNQTDRDLRRKKKLIQEKLVGEMEKTNLSSVQLAPSLFLVRSEKKVIPKMNEEFLFKVYSEFIRTQPGLLKNPLAFAKFCTHCQNLASKKKIISSVVSKLPSVSFEFDKKEDTAAANAMES